MSKVKIQGNASGTGVVTLTAPNTNTDRTITLPDGDISLGVGIDDNATSTAITIDASEKVTLNGTGLQLSPVASLLYQSDGALSYYATNNWVYLNGTSSSGLALYGSGAATKNSVEIAGTDNTPFVKFTVDSAERARFTSDGLTFNGDTAAANALDDYEEGTWTPSFASTSITIDQAKYVKIGNMVNLMCYVTIHSALTSNQFGGFPYASSQYYASTIGYGGSNFIGSGIYSGDDGAGGRFSSGLPTGTGNFMFNHWYKTT